MLEWVGAIIVLIVIGYGMYSGYKLIGNAGSATGSGAIDATRTTSLKSLPPSTEGQYGVQFWCYIKEWNYGFGKEKGVLVRSDASLNSNPEIVLHPSDNAMIFKVSHLPLDVSHGQTYEKFECEVRNIPLQSWFSVSYTQFQRNMDVYINGKLVKSCVIPGVPIGLSTDVIIGSNGGFSGSLSDVTFVSQMLTPSDALAFYQKGSSAKGSETSNPNNPFSRYAVKVALVDDTANKEIKSFSF